MCGCRFEEIYAKEVHHLNEKEHQKRRKEIQHLSLAIADIQQQVDALERPDAAQLAVIAGLSKAAKAKEAKVLKGSTVACNHYVSRSRLCCSLARARS